jgi:NADH dehydrogenase FAD-containing subunit
MRSTDVGASQMIIDGKIKLKNDAQISRFTEKGLEFEDGSTLDADTLVFATGWVKLVHVHTFIYYYCFPW